MLLHGDSHFHDFPSLRVTCWASLTGSGELSSILSRIELWPT